MSSLNYEELKRHVGHNIECIQYGNDVNVAIECNDCFEVILDFDKENNKEEDEKIDTTKEIKRCASFGCGRLVNEDSDFCEFH